MLKTSHLQEEICADPLLYDAHLPLAQTFHPIGHAVEIRSNSVDVLAAAAKLWGRYPVLSHAEPIRIRVIAGTSRSSSSRDPRPPRGEGHLFSIAHGVDDFALADLSAGFAFASLSQYSVSNPSYLCYHFLEPLAYAMLATRHFVLLHASCISRNHNAIVLCGDSGAGKTCLAYACAKRGWEFVSGDAVQVVRGSSNRLVIGRPYEIRFRESARELFPELNLSRAGFRANGKIDLEIDTSQLDIPTALQGLARHIVFIEQGSATRIEKFPLQSALWKFEETICYGDDKTRLQQWETLRHFVGLPIWRLCFSDLDQAEHTLNWLLDEESKC